MRLNRKVHENPVYSGQIWWREFGWRDVHLLLTGGCTQILTFLTICIQISPNLHCLQIRFFDYCAHVNKPPYNRSKNDSQSPVLRRISSVKTLSDCSLIAINGFLGVYSDLLLNFWPKITLINELDKNFV